MYDYSELRGLLTEHGSNMSQLARQLNVSYPAVFDRFHGRAYWNVKQIDQIINLYGIKKKEIPKYFFTKKVKQNLTIQIA